MGNPHGTHEEFPWESSLRISTGNPLGQEFPVGTETRPWGVCGIEPRQFRLDLGNLAWVERALDAAKNFSTPPRCGLAQDSTWAILRGSNPGPEAWGRAGFGWAGHWLDLCISAKVEIPEYPEIISSAGRP